MALNAGATIGRYRIIEPLGRGCQTLPYCTVKMGWNEETRSPSLECLSGTSVVYKAFDPLTKRTLAIKTILFDIPRQSPQYKRFIERFYHEARISGALSHPNIVTLLDIGEDGGLPYLAMEYVKGETIAALLERGHRFKPELVIALASQIASALDYTHRKGIIHRNVKPSNLILFEGNRVKLMDFGIAKLVDAEVTQSGTLLGTPSYMSPEQAMGDELDGRADIYALGVVAYEMLIGRRPFEGSDLTQLFYSIITEPAPPPRQWNRELPPTTDDIFARALTKKPDERYPSASAFVNALEKDLTTAPTLH